MSRNSALGIGLIFLILGLSTDNRHLLTWCIILPVFGLFLDLWIKELSKYAELNFTEVVGILTVLAVLGLYVWEAYTLSPSDLKLVAGVSWSLWILYAGAWTVGWIGVRLAKHLNMAAPRQTDRWWRHALSSARMGRRH
jgi:hypothetical protein